MQDVDAVRAAFVDPQEFWSSPLYRRLCPVVAADPFLVGLAAHARDGQVPTFVFFGAVHALVLAGVEHPLVEYYASVRGDAARPPTDAGPALQSFARRFEAELAATISQRLVQTNQVRRAVGLRLGLAAIARGVGDRPAHLLELGCSAGLLMRHAYYGYRVGGRQFGDAASPVQLVTEWRGDRPPPDLDAVPVIASTCGVDLHPLDPAVENDRRWLEALVWPEDRDKAALLDAALALAHDVPVEVLAGDAEAMCGRWSARIPSGEPRIVFHCATRMHVPVARRAGFDRAIADVADDGPLFHIAVEGDGVQVAEPGGPPTRRFEVEGHLAWAARAGDG